MSLNNTIDRNSAIDSDQWLKPKPTKPRELGSPSAIPVHDGGIPRSPTRRSGKTSQDARRQRSFEDSTVMRGGLWPSATGISVPSPSNSKKVGTLADHLGNERLRDFLDRKGEASGDSPALAAIGRQRSSREIGRFENGDRDKDAKKSTKENHRPILGGSMRYTGKLLFPGRKSSSSSPSNGDMASPPPPPAVPPRYSVDENALYKKVSRRNYEPPPDSESECSDISSSASNQLSAHMSKKPPGIEVPSRYTNDATTARLRREMLDPSIRHSFDEGTGTRSSRFKLKGAIKRAGSLTGYGSAMSQWALSPGRSGSPPMSVENKEKTQSFSSLKPPSSPSRPKGVEKLLNLGLDLFKSKKPTSYTSPPGSGSVENLHQLRMLHNRLVQWQYANARANDTNARIINQAETNLSSAMVSLTKMQHTVLQKKLRMEKERSEMKLCIVLHSQIRLLEKWGDLERQHTSAISKTSECLQSIVSRVPLIDGARIDLKPTSSALRHSSDIAAAVKENLIDLSLTAERTVPLLSELARVVMQEKLIMEECLDYLGTLYGLEVRETSLMCNVVQMKQQMPQEQVTAV